MESLFKVGDVVTIKGQYDEGMDSYDYPFTFVDRTMRLYYGNKKLIVTAVKPFNAAMEQLKECCMYNNDAFYYYLSEEDKWTWHSSMFVEGNNVQTKAINIF